MAPLKRNTVGGMVQLRLGRWFAQRLSAGIVSLCTPPQGFLVLVWYSQATSYVRSNAPCQTCVRLEFR
ncbi:hypothetical protein VTK56DRAFT_9008 [Thermocarpiscus australiensis]